MPRKSTPEAPTLAPEAATHDYVAAAAVTAEVAFEDLEPDLNGFEIGAEPELDEYDVPDELDEESDDDPTNQRNTERKASARGDVATDSMRAYLNEIGRTPLLKCRTRSRLIQKDRSRAHGRVRTRARRSKP